MNHPSSRRAALVLAGSIAALVAVHPSAQAASITLTADDTTGTSLNTGTNWSDGLAPSAGKTYDVPSPRVLRSPNTTANITFAGDSLTLDSGVIFLLKGTAAPTSTTQSILTFNNNATNPGGLILNGGVVRQAVGGTDASTLAGLITVQANSTLSAQFATETLYVNSTITGTANLQIGYTGEVGTVVQSAANTTYSGNLTVGTGSTAMTLRGVNSGTTNVLQAFGTGAITINNTATVQLRANGTGSSQTIVTGSGTTGNNVTVGGAAATIDVNNNTGANTGSTFQFNNLSIGARTLNVTGGNGYGLQFAGTTTLTGSAIFNPTTADLTLGVVTGAQPLTKNGAGTLTINGASNYSGTTTVNTGILRLGDAAALGTTAGNTTIASGATVDLNGQTIAEPFGTIVGAGVGGNGALINNSANTASITGDITGGTSVFTLGGSGNINLARVTGSAGLTLTKIGAGNLTLNGTADNSNLALTLSNGTATLAKASSPTTHAFGRASSVASGTTIQLGGTGDYQIYGGATLTVSGGGVLDLNGKNQDYNALTGSLNLNGAGIGNSGALTNSVSATTSLVTLGTGNIVLQSDSSIGGVGNITVAGVISGSGAALTKVGTGTLTLSSTNTFGGGTTVNAGTLTSAVAGGFGTGNVSVNPTGTTGTGADAATLNSTGSIASAALVTVNTNSTFAIGTVNFNGATPTIGGLTGTGSVVLNNSTGTALTVGSTNNLTSTFTGVISEGTAGMGSLVKAGTGALTLSGANTYTGTTTISAGTLQLGNGGVSGSLSGTTGITNNGMLVVNRNNPFLGSVDLHGAGITGSGGFAQIGSGTTTLDVANTFTGGTVISNGQVSASVSGSLGSGTSGTASIAIANTATLLLTGAGNLDRVRNDAAINLGGGTVAIASGSSEGTAATVSGGTNSNTGSAFGLGALTLSANSTLNFDATGNSTLLVFNSFAAAGFTLNITGYTNTTFDGTANSGAATDDRLVFNSNLTPAQLAAINFGSGITATEIDLGNGYFEVGQAIPEPASLVYLGAALLGLTRWRSRRKAQR